MSDLVIGNGVPGKKAEREFNLREIVFRYSRFLPYVILSVLLALSVAFVKLRYTLPYYQVSGKLMINKDKSESNSNSLNDLFMFGENVNLSNEVEILQSKPISERVVRRLGLDYSYYNIGKVRSSRLFGNEPFRLIPIQVRDSSASFGIAIRASDKGFFLGEDKNLVPYSKPFMLGNGVYLLERNTKVDLSSFSTNEFSINHYPISDVALSMARSIQVSPVNEQASILKLSLETENVNFGKAFINAMMEEYGEMNMEEKRKISQVTIRFIDERLDTLKGELGSVEGSLMRYKEQNEIYDLKNQSGAYFDVLAENNKALTEKQIQVSILNYLLEYLSDQRNQFRIVPSNLGIQEPTLIPLINEYNRLQLLRDNYARTTGAINPALAGIEASIEKLREQLMENLKNVSKSYQIASNDIKSQLNKAKSVISSVPSKERQLLDIERQQKIKQELYLFLLQKREEAAISSAATIANSRVIEYATGSDVPVKPKKRTAYLLALFLGLMIPAAIIAVYELLNDKVITKEEIAKSTIVPIIGEIGHLEEMSKPIVVSYNSRTIIAEQFRIARTNFQYLSNKEQKLVVMITSSMSGEGKSFIAANFGAAISLAGKKTVVLEFDIRKPKLLKNLNMKAPVGISNYVIGKASLDEAIMPVKDYDNLYVMGCGPVPSNPAELLLQRRVEELFEELKKRFDVIVVDTAPVGLVSDGQVLGKFADTCLYVVRQGYTLRKQLKLIDDYSLNGRLPRIGIIVNDIKAHGMYSGYYGYGYTGNYSYSNGSYGTEYFDAANSHGKGFFSKVKDILNIGS